MGSLRPIDLIKSKLPNHRPSGAGFVCRCPSHDDKVSSLSFCEGDDGRALVKCHANKCTVEQICAAIGIKVIDLMPTANLFEPRKKKEKRSDELGEICATYDYVDESGALLHQTVRYRDPKGFRQRRPDGNGGWKWTLKDSRVVLYRLPEILAHDKSKALFIVEGEKDSDNLRRFSIFATTNPMGAGKNKWRPEFAETLRGFKVIVLPDNDESGRMHAREIYDSLQGIAEWCKVVALPHLEEKGDVSDWLMMMGASATPEDVREALKSAIKTCSVDPLSLPSYHDGKSETDSPGEPPVVISGPTSTTLKKSIDEYFEIIEKGLPTTKPTGIAELDRSLQGGGVCVKGMIVIAARPGHGKSMTASQISHHWTLEDPGVFITEEMPRDMVAKRALQYFSDTPEEYWALRTHLLRKDADEFLAKRKPLHLVECCRHVDTVAEQITKHVKEHGCKFGIVDYAQLFRSEGFNRYEKVTNISLVLKQCCVENKIPLIVLCQMSREIEKRDTFIPKLSDLKESGQFDQDADLVIFTVWPWKIDSKNNPKEYHLYIAKNKNGAILDAAPKAIFNPFRQRIESKPITDAPNYEPSFEQRDLPMSGESEYSF